MTELTRKEWILPLIILSTLLLPGCAFHPRQAADIPPLLHTMYLKTTKPYSPLVTELKSMLSSLNITLTKHPSQASYTLDLSNITFTQSNPPITTTTLAVSFTTSLTVLVHIKDPNGNTLIPPKTLSATRSISQNPSQVYTPQAATLAKQELRRDIVSQIYYILVSNNLYKALYHAHKPT